VAGRICREVPKVDSGVLAKLIFAQP